MARPFEASFVREARIALEYSLSNFLWRQAIFFAERLVAECPCEETTYLLALAFFHNQETGRAHWQLQGNRLPEARYLLARCCLILERWDEAEEALFPGYYGCGDSLSEVINGASGLYLLGQAKERQSKPEQAVECYAKCLELCPFMWNAYERWSWLILGSPSPSRSSTANIAAATFSDQNFVQTFANLPTKSSLSCPQAHSPCGAQPRQFCEQRAAPLTVPAASARSQVALPRSDRELPHHALRKERRSDPQRPGGGHGATAGAPWRDGRAVQDPPSLSRRHTLATETVNCTGPTAAAKGGDAGDEASLASLLRKLGIALHSMHNFDGHQPVELLGMLPRKHYETGYVLTLVGLCHFESGDYRKAEQAFQEVWRKDARRVEGLEYYSSALWHLRKDIELGRLAQQCLQWDRFKPQVWCAVGNCFSLQREHDVAIKFFKRAIQVDPSCTYAYTLCGHEFVANEKLDKALPMFEHALSLDSRHYNAWWGLGNIYHRQEEHVKARYHFLKALSINKSNSVLRCYLGMVLDSLNNPLMALENFDKASQGEPQNEMAYYQRACVLMSLERFEEALADLKKVRCLAPKEACVHFQLGKVYMKLQRDKKALLHFNAAMDLNKDSKDYNTIKTHIERLQIRGAQEPEVVRGSPVAGRQNQGRHHSTSSSSNTGDERDPGNARGSIQTASQRNNGGSAPQQTPGGAGAYALPAGGRSLWTSGRSSHGTTFHSPGRNIGISPNSWGTLAAAAVPTHVPGTHFRI